MKAEEEEEVEVENRIVLSEVSLLRVSHSQFNCFPPSPPLPLKCCWFCILRREGCWLPRPTDTQPDGHHWQASSMCEHYLKMSQCFLVPSVLSLFILNVSKIFTAAATVICMCPTYVHAMDCEFKLLVLVFVHFKSKLLLCCISEEKFAKWDTKEFNAWLDDEPESNGSCLGKMIDFIININWIFSLLPEIRYRKILHFFDVAMKRKLRPTHLISHPPTSNPPLRQNPKQYVDVGGRGNQWRLNANRIGQEMGNKRWEISFQHFPSYSSPPFVVAVNSILLGSLPPPPPLCTSKSRGCCCPALFAVCVS